MDSCNGAHRGKQDPSAAAGYYYNEAENPDRLAVQNLLAEIEGAKHAILFNRGTSALGVAACMVPGSAIIAGEDLYGGTIRLLENVRRCRLLHFSQSLS